MKPSKTKKKKKLRASKPIGNGGGSKEDEESKAVFILMEAFESVSIEEAATAYREADCDLNKAAEILGNEFEIGDGDDPSSSASSSCFSVDDAFVESCDVQNSIQVKGCRGSKSKKVIAAAGTVSNVLGKDYMRLNQRNDFAKPKEFGNKLMEREEAEQFLCSLLGDEHDLNMAVVRDVLCQCGYDVEKALEVLLELSSSSYEQSKNDASCNFSARDKEGRFFTEYNDNLTDRASDSTSHSSENDFDDNTQSMAYGYRKYSQVLGSSEPSPLINERISELDIPQMILDSLFNSPKSSEHDPNFMNWRNVVKKMESMGQRFDICSGNAESVDKLIAKGDEYLAFRTTAKQHWNSMKSYYQKAATAYSKGDRVYAGVLSEQGRSENKLAREADEKASQDIFRARNKSMENVITIDLHGQHVKQAMRLLKLHLLFGTCVSSIQILRVITGCGTNGFGKSKLKQSVIDLVEKERIKWQEENRGTVLIILDGCSREFQFLDSESDTD